jgi:hypothetical protein
MPKKRNGVSRRDFIRNTALLSGGLAAVGMPGAARGQTAHVQLAGFDWTPDLELFVLDPRVTITTDGALSRHLMPEPPFPVRFVDVTDASGIRFWHFNGAAGKNATFP